MGCFPILLCSWEDCPSLGTLKGRGESQNSVPAGAAAPSRPLPSWGSLEIVQRVPLGTQDPATMGRVLPRSC